MSDFDTFQKCTTYVMQVIFIWIMQFFYKKEEAKEGYNLSEFYSTIWKYCI